MVGLREDQLHLHGPLYHSRGNGLHRISPNCPACGEREGWPRHFHNCHGPPREREAAPACFQAFALVVCRHPDGRFLMVNEPAAVCHGAGPLYWLPAGRLDRGEGFLAAGVRETLEEGGLRVAITGVLRFSLSHAGSTQPCPRITLLAEPLDPAQPPKGVPDWESQGALWATTGAVNALGREAFRASDPKHLFPPVENGSLVAQPVDTPAFHALEVAMEQLTGDASLRHDQHAHVLHAAWDGLRGAYPTHMFEEYD
mmetsp:Transcript_2292/g.5856  ORF Transcript_2292/g.5856 Transcript_2292/m.5856 type:complete len:256 (-) Transcript_2292:320-1087(-)